MIRILSYLWSGCFHLWKEDQKVEMTSQGLTVGLKVVCTCVHCGAWKSFEVI